MPAIAGGTAKRASHFSGPLAQTSRIHNRAWAKKMKYCILLLFICLGVQGCGNEPTKMQLEIVDRLIQEQIDIPYEEQNWSLAKDILLKNGETVKEAEERNKKLYAEVHDYLVALKKKPYKDKQDWAVNMLELQIEGLERSLKALKNPDDDLVKLNQQWKKWLTILKE